MSETQTYVIKRTARRSRPVIVTLSDGTRRRLNATGTHVMDLTEADVAMLRGQPNTSVTLTNARVVAPEPEPAPKGKAKSRAKAKKK